MPLEDKNTKRRALDAAVDNRSVVDMDELKSFILEQNKDLQHTINARLQETMESNNRANLQTFESILNEKLDNFGSHFDSKIELVRADCMATMDDLSTKMTDRISKLSDDVDDRIDYLERQAKLCDVLIKNIPFRQDENMNDIVYDICGSIEYKNTSAIKSAFRMTRNESRSSPIVMKFFDVVDKREFMYAYFKHQQLNLSDVGFKTKLRIVICEALSRKNNEIFKKAMVLKFKRIFWSVSTKNGQVYYRLDQKSRPSMISTVSSLNAFFSAGTSEVDNQNELEEASKQTKESNPGNGLGKSSDEQHPKTVIASPAMEVDIDKQ